MYLVQHQWSNTFMGWTSRLEVIHEQGGIVVPAKQGLEGKHNPSCDSNDSNGGYSARGGFVDADDYH